MKGAGGIVSVMSDLHEALPPFPASALQEMGKHLGTEIAQGSEMDMHLRTIALSYRTRKFEGRAGLADRKKRFRKLAKATETLSQSLGSMSFNDRLALHAIEPGADFELVQRLPETLALLARASNALVSAKLPRSTEENLTLLSTCRWLGSVYVDATGLSLTHTTYSKGDDTRAPQSPFGKLVRAFFDQVDPNVDATMLDTPLRKLRSEQLKARPQTF